jgi:hypothetical protein
VVFRVNNSGIKLMMSKPCTNCLNYIKNILIEKNYKKYKGIYYDYNGDFKYF